MVGEGRMAEPETIAETVLRTIGRRNDLRGEVVLVTAGGTREALDPVRFIGNRSSGKMGYALAEAARSRGAKVILISGPSALHAPPQCELVKIVTADEMRNAVLDRMNEATLVIKAAAVADYRPVAVSAAKPTMSWPGRRRRTTSARMSSVATSSSVIGPVRLSFCAETARGR